MPKNPEQPDFGESAWFAADHFDEMKYFDPQPSTPRFKVGDRVTSFNGQPRIVTGMTWCVAVRWPHQFREPRMPWGWALTTVHPADPTCIGCGFEDAYSPGDDDGH